MDDYEYGEPDPEYGVSFTSTEPARVISRRRDTEKEDAVSRLFNRHMIDLYNKS